MSDIPEDLQKVLDQLVQPYIDMRKTPTIDPTWLKYLIERCAKAEAQLREREQEIERLNDKLKWYTTSVCINASQTAEIERLEAQVAALWKPVTRDEWRVALDAQNKEEREDPDTQREPYTLCIANRLIRSRITKP